MKLKKLSNVSIDSLCEITIEKNFLEEKVENFERERISLTIKISELGGYSKKLEIKNKEMFKKMMKPS